MLLHSLHQSRFSNSGLQCQISKGMFVCHSISLVPISNNMCINHLTKVNYICLCNSLCRNDLHQSSLVETLKFIIGNCFGSRISRRSRKLKRRINQTIRSSYLRRKSHVNRFNAINVRNSHTWFKKLFEYWWHLCDFWLQKGCSLFDRQISSINRKWTISNHNMISLCHLLCFE